MAYGKEDYSEDNELTPFDEEEPGREREEILEEEAEEELVIPERPGSEGPALPRPPQPAAPPAKKVRPKKKAKRGTKAKRAKKGKKAAARRKVGSKGGKRRKKR